jgi:hypothetical protein
LGTLLVGKITYYPRGFIFFLILKIFNLNFGIGNISYAPLTPKMKLVQCTREKKIPIFLVEKVSKFVEKEIIYLSH